MCLGTILDDGCLVESMDYLDARDLCSAEGTCRRLRELIRTTLCWKALERRCALPRGNSSASCDARIRACRLFKARERARVLEQLASDYFEGCRIVRRGPLKKGAPCSGYTRLPDVDLDPFRRPTAYEFFMRLSYRKLHPDSWASAAAADNLIWEGFVDVDPSDWHTDYTDVLQFRMRGIYAFMNWGLMKDFLQLCRTFRDPINDANSYQVVDNLFVTVVALEKEGSWKTSLVVATGGFEENLGTDGDSDLCYGLRTRWRTSHLKGEHHHIFVNMHLFNDLQRPALFKGFDVTYNY